MQTQAAIKTGDTVRHVPSGEVWTVAYADAERGVLAWCGWPSGLAQLSDCELVEACSKDESDRLLREMAGMTGDDHRKRYAIEALGRGDALERGAAGVNGAQD